MPLPEVSHRGRVHEVQRRRQERVDERLGLAQLMHIEGGRKRRGKRREMEEDEGQTQDGRKDAKAKNRQKWMRQRKY